MAKDKSKKNGSADEGGFEVFSAPPTNSGFKLNTLDNKGDLFVITALGTGETTSEYGPAEYVEAHVIHVDEDDPKDSELHERAWIFGNLANSLKTSVGGGPVLGRLDQGVNKKGNPPWILVAVEDAEAKAAASAAYRHLNSPF